MTNRTSAPRSRLVLLGVAAAVAICGSLGIPEPAGAEGTVETRSPGVTVTITRLTRLLGTMPPSPTRPVPCVYSLREIIDTMVPPGPYEGPAPSEAHRLYLLSCGPEYLRPVWLLPAALATADPFDLLEQAIRELPFPPATIRARPARGLAGLGTAFTVTGHDAAPVRGVVVELGTRVEVEATAGATRWAFGDGTATPWVPAVDGARATHVYERASARETTFAVTARFEWAVRYRVDDGAWIDAAPISRDAVLEHPVTEVRSRLVPGASGTY